MGLTFILGRRKYIKKKLCYNFLDVLIMPTQKFYYTSWVWGIFFIFMMTQFHALKMGLCLVTIFQMAILAMRAGFPDFKNYFSDIPGLVAFQ